MLAALKQDAPRLAPLRVWEAFAPFDAQGGLGKMHALFGDDMDELIDELNGELVA